MEQVEERRPFYTAGGVVIHGRGIGKPAGVPTANLSIDEAPDLPEPGVYISQVIIKGETFCGVTHIGARPTVDRRREPSFETHILDFDRDIYGEFIRVLLYARIRPPKKFPDLPSLAEQIKRDGDAARAYFGHPSEAR
ncbi:MAG: hypothetical protein GX246_04195 [Clostridiales bacterium]|nr:hypothetical protein [Clostridiales bacterium]